MGDACMDAGGRATQEPKSRVRVGVKKYVKENEYLALSNFPLPLTPSRKGRGSWF